MNAPHTVIGQFKSQATQLADQRAMLVKQAGAYEPRTWLEVARDVHLASQCMRKVGVRRGDRIVQLSENRYEWVILDLAMQSVGAIHVPLHAASSAEQTRLLIADCEPSLVIVSTTEQLDKVQHLESLPVWAMDVSTDLPDNAHNWPQVMAEQAAAEPEFQIEQLVADVEPQEIATLLYTSGTLGEPKGVLLTHRNLATNANATVQSFEELDGVRLNILPLSHIFARTCDIYAWVMQGNVLALAESRETLFADCAQVKPTTINAVPFFYERIAGAIADVPDAEKPGALRHLLGGEMKWCCSGGAPLPKHLYDFYVQCDLPVMEGYGLTETSPVISLSNESNHRAGCVGKPIPGVEVRIAEDQEILTRGPHVMAGYYKRPEATQEVIRDGWFHTGDFGELTDDGYVRIIGRKRELIVTNGGKNVAPVQLESLLTADPHILQAFVSGDKRDYLIALLVPNPQVLQATMATQHGREEEASLQDDIVQELFATIVAERLGCLSRYEQVQKFALLEQPFVPETGELTAKLSYRRRVIESRHAAVIKALYES